ncbi:phosphoribosylamine--glycine ligase [Anaerospora sp.]|jgi:phosphoribosylamine--glycine ligase|uniref:phosphoribosylamine--glycine ligase n=1 Tax=Anaerospora sp. TaxID=1960278 RepID=UPI00289F90E2|nr:phosphoribosylamine--glycine ligase [Anaerospora sp.]
MRVLVIGGGGREHALVFKLSQSPQVDEIYCIPGNPGIAALACCVEMDIADNAALAQFARQHDIGLTVVGPEIPLVNGICDYFANQGLAVFGPSRAAAQIEGSKTFAKDLMRKYNIPSARYATFTLAEEAKAYIREQGAPIVVKADGLAAGKGVVVALDVDEALTAVDTMMTERIFGDAGTVIVVEEFMEGEEASLLAFTDGYTVVPMVAAQDHKRIFDNDAGPNTGGMGTYAPAPVVTEALKEQIVREVLQPAVEAMRKEGCLYKGCLYAGLMITAEGPKVVEFNARFGDPETQVVLPLLKTDLMAVLMACVNGTLADTAIEWSEEAAVCVVLAAGGYPGWYQKGHVISGIENAEQQGALVFQAGTASEKGSVVTAGGRVLGVTAVSGSIADAVDKVYGAIPQIHFTDMQYRRDIAHRALRR